MPRPDTLPVTRHYRDLRFLMPALNLPALRFDTQVAEKIAQKFALQGRVILRDHRLPAPQIVVYQNQFDQRADQRNQRKSDRHLRIAVPDLLAMNEKQLHEVPESSHFELSGFLIEGRPVARLYELPHRAQ